MRIESVARAPIVVSELDEEEDSGGEQRDDLEELKDFTSLLMPAARKSAARRLNGGQTNRTSPTSRRNQHQRSSLHAAKFPVIDEDLLALAARREQGTTTPPPNLCRLITNVSECRWTSKMAAAGGREGHKKDRPKSVGHMPRMTEPILALKQCNTTPDQPQPEVPPRVVLRKDNETNGAKTNGNSRNLLSVGNTNNELAALRRLSALSMVSSVSSYTQAIDDGATNCDCTSLAWAALRGSNGVLAAKRRKHRALQQQQKGRQTAGRQHHDEEADDSYRKTVPSSALAPDSPANDSGISSSSESSRSASLAEAGSRTIRSQQHGQRRNSNCCSMCGRTMQLPPLGGAVSGESKLAAVRSSRRRRVLSYLLGNMMRLLEMPQRRGGAICCTRCGAGIDLKLLPTSATDVAGVIPLVPPTISVEMAATEDERSEEEVHNNRVCSEREAKRIGGQNGKSTEYGGGEQTLDIAEDLGEQKREWGGNGLSAAGMEAAGSPSAPPHRPYPINAPVPACLTDGYCFSAGFSVQKR